MTANMRIVANIVAAARACRPSHLVYVGSDSVFAFTDALIDEDTVPQPFDLYGLSHFARERLALWASVAPTAIVRLSQVFGASDRHDAYGPARFLRTALTEGRIRLFGGGEELRDHVPLADVTAALDACLKHRGEGVLHVASGRPIAFHAVARIVADAVTPTPVIEEAPRRQPITHRRIAVDRLRATFPWLTPTPLETAVAEVAAVWRASPLHRPGGLV
jgi:nucleoside-diphosphate-sugar epimerase